MQATPGLDAGGVRAYRIALSRSFAADRLREGLSADASAQVEIGIAITAAGVPERVELLRSSGQPALDARILAAVHAAAHGATVPGVLLGQAFVLSLPLEIGPRPDAPTSAPDR